MTKLLVSVRSANEAAIALEAGVDLIDIKEPRRGSLGPAEPTTWSEVLQTVGGRVPVSAALGELCADDVARSAREAQGLAFAKIGLAGCRHQRDWAQRLQETFALLPKGTLAVAVAYADAGLAGAPPPDAVLQAAQAMDCRVLLVDTYDKSAGGLLRHLPLAGLADYVREVRRAGLQIVLGGSLTSKTLREVLGLAPDYVAIRGAVCRGGRDGVLDGRLVERFVGELRRRTRVNVAESARPLG